MLFLFFNNTISVYGNVTISDTKLEIAKNLRFFITNLKWRGSVPIFVFCFSIPLFWLILLINLLCYGVPTFFLYFS